MKLHRIGSIILAALVVATMGMPLPMRGASEVSTSAGKVIASPSNHDLLNLRIFNTRTGRHESYDAQKHLPFPKDLREEAFEKDLAKVKQEAQHRSMNRDEEHVHKMNVAEMRQGAIHLVRKSGELQDENGYLYSHIPSGPPHPSSFPYIGGGPAKIAKDSNGQYKITAFHH